MTGKPIGLQGEEKNDLKQKIYDILHKHNIK